MSGTPRTAQLRALLKTASDAGAAALATVAPGAAALVRAVLFSRLGRRVLAGMILAAVTVVGGCTVVGVVVLTTIISAPSQVAASVLGWVSGLLDGDQVDPPAGVLCAPQPEPTGPAEVPPSLLGAPPDAEDGDAEHTPQEQQLLSGSFPALSDNGRMTGRMLEYLQAVPPGTSARQAHAWLLYGPTHPAEDWAGFEARYRAHADTLSQYATGADIAAGLDPYADYRPYALAAAAGAFAGVEDKRFTADTIQESALAATLVRTCLPPGAQPGPRVRTQGDPVVPAEHPGWTPVLPPPPPPIPPMDGEPAGQQEQ